MRTVESINEKSNLQNDNVFVKSEIKDLAKLTGIPTRRGLEMVVISEGEIVNVVSDSYGHLPNEKFFYDVERKLINAGVNYVTRSINRENRSFAVDYILDDKSYEINVKKGNDIIKPMLRFTNSYDGSSKTSGHFGFFRKVCSNGLHVAETHVGFSVKHRGNIIEVVMPEVEELIQKFMDNEFYSLKKKFEVMAKKELTDPEKFVKEVCDKLNIFKFEHESKKQTTTSLNARLVLEVIERESKLLNEVPNYWVAYNAFNNVLHNKMKKSFENQKNLDSKLFDFVLEAAKV